MSLYQVYQALLCEHMFDRPAEPRDSTSILKALAGKLDIKKLTKYSKTCLKLPLKKKTKNWFSRQIIT